MSIDFGNVVVSNSSPASVVTVTNSGGRPTGAIEAIVTGLNAADYKLADNCDTLNPMGTCTVTVTFSPASAGAKLANLVISSSPGGSVMSNLSGTATN